MSTADGSRVQPVEEWPAAQPELSMTASPSSRLVEAARRVAGNAYCPYSQFPVGAAVITHDGDIYAGCNVENASFGLACCAERSALFAAVAAGVRRQHIAAMAIYTPGPKSYTSCGACRQVINELVPAEAPVLSTCDDPEQQRSLRACDLLPDPFALDG